MFKESTRSNLDDMSSVAVQRIVSGRFDESVEILTNILKEIQHEILGQTESPSNPENHGSAAMPQNSALPSVPQYYQVDMDDGSSASQIHSLDIPGTEPKIFASPLVVPETSTSELYQFCVTYNLALSYHLAAMTQQDGRKLEVALGLWDLVYRFHWNDDLGLTTFHTCAILNNYGLGLRQVGAEKGARECFYSLLCALCVSLHINGTQYHRSGFDARRTECFFHNVSSLVLKDPMTARAA